jgi:hypothetical protein
LHEGNHRPDAVCPGFNQSTLGPCPTPAISGLTFCPSSLLPYLAMMTSCEYAMEARFQAYPESKKENCFYLSCTCTYWWSINLHRHRFSWECSVRCNN